MTGVSRWGQNPQAITKKVNDRLEIVVTAGETAVFQLTTNYHGCFLLSAVSDGELRGLS